MKRSILIMVLSFLVPFFLASISMGQSVTQDPAAGHFLSDKIQVPKGFPPVPPKAKWLGELKGSWYDIGYKFGEGSAYYSRYIYDYYYTFTLRKVKTKENLIASLHRYEKQIEAFNPNYIEWMKGMGDGAAAEFKKSTHADAMTNYEKAILMQVFTSLYWRYPGLDMGVPGTDRGKMLEGAFLSPEYGEYGRKEHPIDGCTGIAVLPKASATGKLMVTHNAQTGMNMGNYVVAYVATPPPPANRFFVLTIAGSIASAGVLMNEKGMTITHLAGPGNDNAFGVPWCFLAVQALTDTDNPDEAAKIMALGTENYRAKTGRKTVLREGGIVEMIADKEKALVFEAMANSYAIRRPGDHGEKDFIVVANHFYANHSYDENNVRTNVPMDKRSAAVDAGPILPEPGTFTRYWSLHWSGIYNHGKITPEILKGHQFNRSHHWYDKRGNKIEYLWSDKDKSYMPVHYLYDHSTVCGHAGGYPEKYTNDLPQSKVVTPADLTHEWTTYRPCMWNGAWDKFQFK